MREPSPRTGPQLTSISQSGSSSLLSNAVTDMLPHNVNLCRCKKLSSPECQLCRWPMYLTPAWKPSIWYASLPGMMMSLSSSLPSTTWHQGFRSPLTYQASNAPSLNTLYSWLRSPFTSLSWWCLLKLTLQELQRGRCISVPDPANACRCSHHISIITLEVLSSIDFLKLCKLLRAKATDRARLEQDIRHVIIASLQHLVKNELIKKFLCMAHSHIFVLRNSAVIFLAFLVLCA